MSRNHKDRNMEHVRVELKYCEHCGGLWVREGGAGVYCEKCQPKVADLPTPRKRAGRVMLPVRQRTVVDEYPLGVEDVSDMEAAGGVA